MAAPPAGIVASPRSLQPPPRPGGCTSRSHSPHDPHRGPKLGPTAWDQVNTPPTSWYSGRQPTPTWVRPRSPPTDVFSPYIKGPTRTGTGTSKNRGTQTRSPTSRESSALPPSLSHTLLITIHYPRPFPGADLGIGVLIPDYPGSSSLQDVVISAQASPSTKHTPNSSTSEAEISVLADLIKISVSSGDDSQLVREDDLHSAMREKFRDESLLIVLDDAWCDESVKWRLLQSSLSKGAKAHALIVTTRNKAVARAIRHDSEYLEHGLLGLPDTECMEIFKRWAFMGEQAERYLDDLEGLSRRVVQKLKGNPLAATMMSSFLHEHLGNRTMWINVVEDWPHTNEGNVVDRVVELSYLHLSRHLKLCFANCALLPKGFEFDKKTLVQMWIAQGYVQSPPGVLMEHSGSDHFDYLYQRSFFQFESYSYTMHDLIHDFAQKVFTEGCQMDASDTEDGTWYEEIRHLSFHCNNYTEDGTEPTELKSLHNFKKLRTLMLELDTFTAAPPAPLDVLAKFKYLRLLVLEVRKLSEFPDSIRHLQFLRYLDIRRTYITALPEFVCDLVELRFLILPYRCALPEGMNKLTNLRFIKAGREGVPQFKGIGQLTSLQVGLVTFKVENKSGWKISELKDLNHLHGKLVVGGLGNVTCREETEQACLTQKKYLEELVLDWTADESQVQQHVRNEDVESQVLEGLFPPPNLKVLSIRNNRGARFPSWMEERCPISSSLVRLELDGCCNWECLPTLGRWPCLKELYIRGAHGVKKIGPEFYGGGTDDDGGTLVYYFPRLEMLLLQEMRLWEEWEMPAAGEIHNGGGRRHVLFPSLKELIIVDCPKLASLAPILRHHSTNLETLGISGCGELASLDGCG